MSVARKSALRAMIPAAAVLLVLSAPVVRADEEDCETAVDNVDDAVQVASKALQSEMAEIGKKKPENETERAAVRKRFCIWSGEFVGISSAYRVVIGECTTGSKRRDSLASLDKSIGSLLKSIKETCE
jgi:hypothetical protein